MERSWWWKAALYGAVLVLACLYLVPTVVPEDKQPALIKKYFTKRIQKGLDIAGGLRLVYEVNLQKAVSTKVDQIANSLEDNLRKKTEAVDIERVGRDEIVFKFKNKADVSKIDDEVLAEYRDDLEELERNEATGVVRYGIDSDQVAEIQDFALRQGIETIRGRVDKYGVTEPTIIKKGTDIVVELPGLDQAQFERIKNIIGRTAQLQFKVVADNEEYPKKVAAAVPKDSGITVVPDPWTEEGVQREVIYLEAKDRAALEKFASGLTGDLAPPNDREWGFEEVRTKGADGSFGEATWRSYLLYRRAGVTGDYLADADVGFSQEIGSPEVYFTMNSKGGELMGKLTGENVGRRMAIVLDDRIMSAPVIQSQINDRGRITLGMGDPTRMLQEAQDLVAVLRSGALPAPLTKTFETQIGKTLGDTAIERALFSMYIGAGAVILFMLIYYRLSGLIALIAMALNLLLIVAILAAFEAALTLPGIAGLVLTIGMAVDANIIIYERIREELRLGKSPRTSVEAGFSRAFWTIFDAQVTTFAAGVVLYSYGSGPIRGFAVTLLVGIVCNLFTAIWFSRWLFGLMVNRRGATPATLSI